MYGLVLNAIREWLVAISTSFSLVAGTIGSLGLLCVAIRQYKLKAAAEERLHESMKVEADIRLSKLFAELMSLAHARGETHVSEKCIEELFEKGIITGADKPKEIKKKIEDACIYAGPVGKASQVAAVMAIGVLGREYEILREPARAGLGSLKSIKEIETQAEEALALLDHKKN